MGTTTKYGLPWPAVIDKVKDGATAIRVLAEAVEEALRPPLLITDGSGVTSWSSKVAEVGWDVTDSPDRKRGSWDSNGGADQLVIPGSPGYYLVSASVRFGGKAEPDWYDLQLRTRQTGDGVGAGNVQARQRVEQPANSTSFVQLNVAGIVRIADTTPRSGFAIRLEYGGANNPPDVGAGVNKLNVYRLSAL